MLWVLIRIASLRQHMFSWRNKKNIYLDYDKLLIRYAGSWTGENEDTYVGMISTSLLKWHHGKNSFNILNQSGYRGLVQVYLLLPLKTPRKPASANVICFCHLLKFSCKHFKPIFAYRQIVWTKIRLLLEEQSDLGPHCLQKWLLKSQADDKADDNCCDWQFKGSGISFPKVSVKAYVVGICHERRFYWVPTTCFFYEEIRESHLIRLLNTSSGFTHNKHF